MDTNDTVSLSTLKDQGFTDEDLSSVIETPEPTPEPEVTPEPATEPEPIAEPEQDPATNGDAVSKHVPYDRFKEVNEKNKVLAARIAALEAQQSQPPLHQPQPQPLPQPQNNISREEWIANQAEEAVKLKFKVVGDIDDLQYSDPAIYRKCIKELAKQEIRLEDHYDNIGRVQQDNNAFIAELTAKPDFNVLLKYADNELAEMPNKLAKPINDAIARLGQRMGTPSDLKLVAEFTEQCREKINNTNTPPNDGGFSSPKSSPLDKAAGLPKAQGLSGAKTSAMSWAQVEDLIRQGKADQIPKDMLKQIDPRLV